MAIRENEDFTGLQLDNFTIKTLMFAVDRKEKTERHKLKSASECLLPKCNALQCLYIEAYRSNALFNCDILRSIFRAASGRNAGKKAAKCCRIFGFNTPSRQFIFNALS